MPKHELAHNGAAGERNRLLVYLYGHVLLQIRCVATRYIRITKTYIGQDFLCLN